MCAIVGLMHSRHGFREPTKVMAFKMLAEMASRGPDSSSVIELVKEGIALGHNRLAIVGRDDAIQPIVSDGIMVAANGEIYNWRELRAEFPDREWKTGSDCEVLIPLYEKYGIEGMLNVLEGEFAFILHDSKNLVSYAARDRFGIKPLFFTVTKGGTLVASTLRAFRPVLPDRKINWEVVGTCLAMHYPPLRDTIIRDIESVLPGSYIKIKNGEVVGDHIWWRASYPHEKLSALSNTEVDEMLRDAFVNAVKKRIPDRARWCTSLSGGFDSSAVLGAASRLSGKKVDCFTVVFPDARGSAYDELEIARRTAKFNNANLIEVPLDANQALDSLKLAISNGEGFCVNGHIVGKHLLANAMHCAGNKVTLVGEGADECLFGYSHLKVDMFGEGGSKLMQGTETPVGEFLEINAFYKLPYLSSFLKAKLSTGKKVYGLLLEEFQRAMQPYCCDFVAEEILHAMDGGNDKAEKTMCAWLATAFPSYICKVLGDGCEMSNSIEGRLPFLDTKLWSIASRLPTSMKMSKTSEKIAMRRALRDFVTPEIRDRPKQPFQAPPISALCSKKKWNDLIDQLTSGVDEVFDNAKLRDFMKRLKAKSNEEQAIDEPVWMLAMSYKFLVDNLVNSMPS